jgi:polysaccharide biosynthesis/export protein
MLFRQFTFISFLLLSAVSPVLGQNNNLPPGTLPPGTPPHKPLSQREPPPGSSQYKLRSGDTIQLDFRLSPELSQTALIDPDGSVSLLVIGRVQIAGLTVQDARQLIISKESEHLKNPEVSMQVTNFQHYYVVVAGEVYQPQKIEMRDDMTALQAIVLAGGVKISGRETQVLLYRRVNAEFAEVHKLNMRIKKTSQLENDMKLEPGDLILVPRNKVESVARYVRIVGFGYNFQPTAF